MLMLNALIVALVATSSVWVYLDATKHKIGKVAGLKSLFNMSAGAWAIVTLLLWIIGFPAYLLKRKSLIKLASSHPVEFDGRGIKTAILSIVGGVWFLAAAANALTGYENETGNSHPNGKNWFDAATSAVPSSDWMLSEKTSGIDGKTLIATRAYQFSSQNAQFDVEIACQPGKKSTLGDLAAGNLGGTSRLSIKSFVGDTAKPSESSARVSETNFVRQNDYSNPAELNYPTSRIRIGENIYSGPMAAMVLRIGDYSNEAIFTGLLNLGESIPMAVELKNGAGTFEIEIDRSDEVERVLAACGLDAASLARAKAEQQRKQANDVVLEALERSCQRSGDATTYDSAWVEKRLSELSIPPDTASDVELDCEKSAPQFLAAYHSQIDGHYRTYLNSKEASDRPDAANGSMPACSKEEFKAYLKNLGGADMGAADFAVQSASQPPECEQRIPSTNSSDIDNASAAAMDAAASAADGAAEDPERSW